MRTIPRRVINRYMRAFVDSTRHSKTTVVDFRFEAAKAMCERDDFPVVLALLEGLDLVNIHRENTQIVAVSLTHEGRCYFERKAERRRKFILESIAIPILVALIISIITVYILPSVGRQAQRWLSGTPQYTPPPPQVSAPTYDP